MVTCCWQQSSVGVEIFWMIPSMGIRVEFGMIKNSGF